MFFCKRRLCNTNEDAVGDMEGILGTNLFEVGWKVEVVDLKVSMTRPAYGIF